MGAGRSRIKRGALGRRGFLRFGSLIAVAMAFPESALSGAENEDENKDSNCNLDEITALDLCVEREYGDYSVKKYEHILRKFSETEPYLEMIHDACKEFSSIYPISVELEVAKLMQESKFDPNAVSKVGAAGIPQLMPTTAKELGLEVYVDDNFTEGFAMFGKGSKLERDAYEAFKKLDERCLGMRKEALTLNAAALDMLGAYKENLLEHKEDDERISDKEKAIRMGVKYLAQQIKAVADYFHSPIRLFNEIRGLAAYNAGFEPVKKYDGLPAIEQTVDYVRKIMRNLDSIYIYKKWT